jgi:hypothetical protein
MTSDIVYGNVCGVFSPLHPPDYIPVKHWYPTTSASAFQFRRVMHTADFRMRRLVGPLCWLNIGSADVS